MAWLGIRLLQKMGWRQGKGIGTVDTSASGVGTKGGSRWGRVAGVGVENTPLYALKPKDTLHGLGFDPFKVWYSGDRDFCHPCVMFMMNVICFLAACGLHRRLCSAQCTLVARFNFIINSPNL